MIRCKLESARDFYDRAREFQVPPLAQKITEITEITEGAFSRVAKDEREGSPAHLQPIQVAQMPVGAE
jgi:hypothetical protein